MQNENQHTSVDYSNSTTTPVGSGVVVPPTAQPNPEALSEIPATVIEPVTSVTDGRRKMVLQWSALMVGVVVLVIGVILLLSGRKETPQLATNAATQFDTVDLPLNELGVTLGELPLAKIVTINGLLDVSGSLVLTPSVQPSAPQPGQLYYDKDTNLLAYFNGTQFVAMTGGGAVEQLGSLTGQIGLGAGLGEVGGQLSNTGVLSVQGQTGAVTLVAGNGIVINGTTITNDGVVSVVSSSPAITVTDDGNGTITLTGSGGGTVSSPGGNTGRIAKFTGAQQIGDSLLSESGTTITVNGDLDVTGSVTFSSPLTVANGGSGATSLAANGVLVGNGTSPVTSVVSGSPGECLVSTAGNPTWATCNPSNSAVNSINGLTGTLTIANATGLVNTITIDDASTSNKGIVQFNGTNFSVVGGVANTIQNINTTASPTFSSLTLTGDIAVNGGDITSTGALNITPASSLTAGSTTQALTLQGNASSVFTATSGANTTTIGFQAPGANVTYRFATAAAGTYDVCTTVGNCAGGGGVIGNGTAGTIPKFTAAAAIGDSLISEAGSTITVNGNLNLVVGNQYQINGTQISSANLSNDANLAKLNASQTFTGNNVAFQNGSNSATAFAVQNALGNRVATIDTTDTELELGQGSTVGGRLVFSNATNNNTVTMVSAVVTSNRTITLPDDSGTICLDTGNCAGAGATLQTSYNNSSSPEITLDGTRGALTLRDNSTPLGANLLEVQNNAGGVTYFAVTSAGASVTGSLSATGNINSSGGALQTGGTTRVDNSGNLSSIGNIALGGTISGGTTITGSGNLNSTGGAIQTNSLTRIDNSGNLANIGTITTSGAINGQTISSASTFTGTVTIQGSTALTLGVTGTSTGAALFKGSTAASGTITLTAPNNPSNNTLTLPNESGTLCSTGSICSGYQAAGSYANTALSNLASVAINTTLLPGTAGTINLGSGTLPFGDIFLAGTSGTPGTNNFRITGASTSGTRVITLPDATGTVCLTTGNCAGSGTGVTSLGGGTANRLAKFTAAQNVENSTISDDGTTVTTTVDLVIQGGDATIGVASAQTGALNFAHSGSANLGSIVQGALTGGRTYTLPDSSGTFCLTSGNCSGSGSSNTLQAAYDAGNIITTTTNRDIDIELANTGTDSNLDIVIKDDSTSTVLITRENGTGTNDPAQLLLLDNLDANRAVAAGIKLQAATGGLTTALDASDAEIVDALNVGANNIVGTTGDLNFSNFDVVGATGNVTAGTYNSQTISATANLTGTLTVANNVTLTSGDIAVNGGDITSTGTLTVTPGGALTLGDTGQTALLRGSTTTITSTGAGNDITLNSADTIELQDNTNVTGNMDISGTLAVGTTNAFQVAATGDVTTAGNGILQGGSLTLGTVTQSGELVLHDGAGQTGSLVVATLGQATTYTLPDPGGAAATICLSTGNCLGPGGSGANTALSNLASVAINTTLLPGTAGTINLGSGTLPFGDIFLAGTSGTPGTNNFRITGASTSGTRVITLPDASGTVCLQSGVSCGFAPTSGSANYIQNQIASPQTADFNISGDGRAATFNATTGINTGAGAGTQRIDASGNLANIGTLTLSGAISGGTTVTGSGNFNTTTGALQTNSITRVDNSGNLTNIGNLTATGAITIASSGGGNDVIIDGADQFIMQDVAVFNTDVDFALADTENVAITNTVTGANAVNLINTVLTNNTSGGTQQVALLQNAAGSGSTEALLVLDNADTDTAVASGLQITSAAGAITNALDVSDADIVTALLFGANDLSGTNFSVTGSSGNVTGGTYNGQTLSATANLTGTLTVANNLTLTSGDIAVNGGDITSTGALNVTPGGMLTVGATNAMLTLQGNGSTILTATDSGNTTTVGFTTPTADATFNFPALSAGTYDICTSDGNCLGAGVTLQAAYDNSTTPEIVVNTSNGALTVRDNSTPIGGNLLEVQNNAASTTYFAITSSGVSITGTNISSGNVNTTAGTLQTNSISRIDNSGNLLNIGNLTASGALTIASSGGGNDITIDGADQLIVQDASVFNGTITVASLGTTNTATYLCLNSGNLVANCNTTGTGAAFVQGGNSFGATATLGTNDSNGLDIRTNGVTRMSFGSGGGISIPANNSADELEIGDNIADVNDNSTRINVGTTNGSGNAVIRVGESTLLFGAMYWDVNNNLFNLSTGFDNVAMQLQANGGSTTIKGTTTLANTTDSVNSFVIQNANSVPGFNVDTTTPNVIANHSFETNTTGWTAHGAATLSRVTTQYYDNNASLQAATTAAANDGARYAYSLTSSTQYSFSIFVKASVAGNNALELGRSENGSSDTSCATSSFNTGLFVRYTCTFTTGTVTGSPYVYIKQTDSTARNIWIDAVQLETAASATTYRNVKTALSGTMYINGGSNLATAANMSLAVRSIGGGDGLHVIGNGENNIFQHIFMVEAGDGSTLVKVNESSRGTTIEGGSSFFNAAALTVVSTNSGAQALTVQGASGQTVDVFKVQDNSATKMFAVGATGAVGLQNTTDSTNAFEILNASGRSVVRVDTSGGNQNNIISNPSFEVNTTGWAAKGSPTTFARTTAEKFTGVASLSFTKTTTQHEGAKFNATLTDSTNYVVSFYAKIGATSSYFSSGDTISAGYSSDGTNDDTPASCDDSDVTATSWRLIQCTFTTPASHSGTPFFYIKSPENRVLTYYIDGVLLQTDANAESNYREGKISLQGTVSSSLIVQNDGNNGTAFMVQNTQGSRLFSIDNEWMAAGGNTNLVTNSDFETNTAGWQADGTGASISRDLANRWTGRSALKIVTGTAAGGGAKFITGANKPTRLDPSSPYRLGFYAKRSADTITDLDVDYSADGTSGGETSCTLTSTTINTAWTYYSCSISTPASPDPPSANAYLIFQQTSAGPSRTFWIDGITLTDEFSSNPGAYGAGRITISGVVTSPLIIQNVENSTEAFLLMDEDDDPVLTIDTVNRRIIVGTIGQRTGSAFAPTTLVLDNSTSVPTGTNGAMYYDSTDNKFKCYENGAWINCIADPPQIVTFTSSSTFTKAGYPGLKAVIVEVQGGGGGSGGAALTNSGEASVGGAGGGGGYCKERILASSLASSETVTVGTGGAGGSAGANNGSSGGNSSFGSFCSGNGGGGGTGGTTGTGNTIVGAGNGGTASGGDINIAGSDGEFGVRLSTGPLALRVSTGGASHMAGSIRTTGAGSGGAGVAGYLYGGGASGALNGAGQAAKAGGDGGNGIVIVTLFF